MVKRRLGVGLIFIGFMSHCAFGASAALLREELKGRSLQYFLDHMHPDSGLVRDRAFAFRPTGPDEKRMASLAATGFGFAVLAHAAEEGKISRTDAESRILRGLRTIASDKVFKFYGWYYHFVDWVTGERWKKNEVSTIDTALLVAGALYAAEVFPGTELAQTAHQLYRNLNFDVMRTDAGADKNRATINLGWTPEEGFLRYQWKGYSELLILLILGLGHEDYPLGPAAATAWKEHDSVKNPFQWTNQGKTYPVIGSDLPLFIHQYPLLFLDMRGLKDEHLDYFENSRYATQHQRSLMDKNAPWKTLQQDFWGISASDTKKGYRPLAPGIFEGTVCPGCAGASVMFDPDVVLADLNSWKSGPLAREIYSQYGFVDAFNIDQNWFGQDVIGITVGALYLALANTDSKHSIWSKFMRIESIQRGLKNAGFTKKAL